MSDTADSQSASTQLVVIPGSVLEDIADAIIEKDGGGPMYPSQMAGRVRDIEGSALTLTHVLDGDILRFGLVGGRVSATETNGRLDITVTDTTGSASGLDLYYEDNDGVRMAGASMVGSID